MGQSAEELKRDIESTRGDLGETLEAIGDRVSPARMIERRKNRVMHTIHQIRERVMGAASDTGHAVTDTAGGAVNTLTGTPTTVRQQTQGSPLVAGALAFGVGALAASIFGASEIESQAADHLMEKAEPLTDQLKQTGQEMAEHMKQPALDAIDQVKEAVVESSQAVTDTAKDAAGTSKEAAQQAADAVRSETTDSQSNQQS